jgi:hypothetical protein
MLASGSDDRTVRLWDVRTHKALGEPLRATETGSRAWRSVRTGARWPPAVGSCSMACGCGMWPLWGAAANCSPPVAFRVGFLRGVSNYPRQLERPPRRWVERRPGGALDAANAILAGGHGWPESPVSRRLRRPTAVGGGSRANTRSDGGTALCRRRTAIVLTSRRIRPVIASSVENPGSSSEP